MVILFTTMVGIGGHVTFFIYSTGMREMVLNCIYSYVVLGDSTTFLVATMGHESLAECISLGLPCYNMTSSTDSFMVFGSTEHVQLGYLKVSPCKLLLYLPRHACTFAYCILDPSISILYWLMYSLEYEYYSII